MGVTTTFEKRQTISSFLSYDGFPWVIGFLCSISPSVFTTGPFQCVLCGGVLLLGWWSVVAGGGGWLAVVGGGLCWLPGC